MHGRSWTSAYAAALPKFNENTDAKDTSMSKLSPPEVRAATSQERDWVLSTIEVAFINDPVMRFCWPRAKEYLAGIRHVANAMGGKAFEHGSAYLAPEFSGVALWVPPGVHPDLEPIGSLMVETVDAALHEDLFGMLGEMAAFHPEEDHWYLAQIGVDPFYQAQGVGAALMKHALTRCDTDGTPCYLESSNPRNISLYERFGFERVGEIQVGRSPIMTPMIRPAQG